MLNRFMNRFSFAFDVFLLLAEPGLMVDALNKYDFITFVLNAIVFFVVIGSLANRFGVNLDEFKAKKESEHPDA